MNTTYPTTKQTLPNPTATDLLENANPELDHDYQHSTINDTVEALQDTVGMTGSAVTTSHAYKLGEVTGTDKAVGKTATQTLSNKTLTAPQINMGSDATGDMYYRNGSGVTTRFPIGAEGSIPSVVSGVPVWIPNPAAADASTTVKGVSEIATTAEITAGTSTGGTGAVLVVPASAVGTPGASKLVQFDGTGKYPAADGSQISNITRTGVVAYAVNADEAVTDYKTLQIPSPNDVTGTVWTLTTSGITITEYPTGSAMFQTGAINADATAMANPRSIRTGLALAFGSSTNIRMKVGAIVYPGLGTGSEDRYQFLGFSEDTGATPILGNISVLDRRVGFAFYNGAIYALCADESAVTSTNVGTYSATSKKEYMVILNGTTSALFYIDGVLVATISTNIPTSNDCNLSFQGCVGTGQVSSGFLYISHIVYSEKLT